MTVSNMNIGDWYFHQLAARFNKRLRNGLQFFVNYSHSRLMDHTAYPNAGSLALEKRVAADDRPDYVAISSLYDLPVGRGRRYLANTNRVLMFVLGNWQVNTLRIASMNNFNVNLTKSFLIHENLRVQFRAESFNLTRKETARSRR